jgi:predicted Zn-dependent peptidase
MYFERFFSLDETIDQIETVSADEVCQMANHLFQPDKVAITVLGNLDGLKLSRENLVC